MVITPEIDESTRLISPSPQPANAECFFLAISTETLPADDCAKDRPATLWKPQPAGTSQRWIFTGTQPPISSTIPETVTAPPFRPTQQTPSA